MRRALIVLAVVLGAVALAAPAQAGNRHALAVARNQIGDPYRYGAAGPNAFDCSGLTYYAYHHAGYRGLPRTSSAQASFTHRERRSQMHRGDLVFFYDRGGVYHVGIFIGWHHGHRWIIHSPYSGQRVHRERIWTNSWFPGTLR
jgi:cell wall-associated NlpC family hydrolase